MSDVLKKLRSKSRKGLRLTRSRLGGNLKKKIPKQFRSLLLGQHQQKHSEQRKYESDKRVSDFRRWCRQMYIGEHGSCHKIGVIATGGIKKGECLARIPREAILSCANSTVAGIVKSDKELRAVTSSWIPLLIALSAEYSLKHESHWHAYLELVPNNEGCGPPMLWSELDRHRLLQGTCVNSLVDGDLERIEADFRSVVLPFMQKHPQIFRTEVQNCQVYKKLVSLVMSYSFTDGEEETLTSSTMMVPFVDLLNHSSEHHAQLTFTQKALELMVVRDIEEGEEIMNTYGELSNTSLLHTYGFCEISNPHDMVLISTECIRHVYMAQDNSDKQEKHWEKIQSDDLLEEDYCIDRNGDIDPELLLIIKLLHYRKNKYESLVRKQRCGILDELTVQDLNEAERAFLVRLAKYRLSQFPESYDSLLPLLSEQAIKMTEKERYSLYLSIGQQHCLTTLLEEVGGSHEL